MQIRERITGTELTNMYARLGFFPLEGSPFTFVRDSDETMLFHDPIHDTDEFLWIVVLRDIRRTETLYPEIAGTSRSVQKPPSRCLRVRTHAEIIPPP